MKETNIMTMLSVFNEIKAMNPSKNLLISGSLALHMQGMQLRNSPKDLDICTYYDIHNVIMPKGAIAINATNLDDVGYSADICQYMYKGVKIDILTLTREDFEYKIYRNSYPILSKICIIKYKMSHALFDTMPSTVVKHKEDLIYILKNN